MKFRPKNQNELAELEDEALIEYLVSARDAGDIEAMSVALYVFVYARSTMIETKVALKTPPHVRAELVETIIGDVCVSASRSFKGEHVGELVNFIKTVTGRRIADYVDREKRQLKTDPLAGPGVDDEEFRGEDPSGSLGLPQDELLVREAIREVMETRSEEHSRVIILRRSGMPSKQVAEELPGMSVANIDQIFARFRKDLLRELDE